MSGDPGRLTETIHSWTPADGPLPELTDVTASWGLDGWAHSTSLGFGGPVAVGVHAPEAIVGVRESGQAQIELTIPGFEPLSLEADLGGDRTQLDVACPRQQ